MSTTASKGPTIPVRFILQGPNEGHSYRAELGLGDLFGLYRILNETSIEDALALVNILRTLNRTIHTQQPPFPNADNALSLSLYHLLDDMNPLTLEKLDEELEEPDKPEEASEDQVLGFTYLLLRKKLITYDYAADIASAMLIQTFTPEAWRKRIARYAKAKNLKPVEVPRGRPKKKRTNNT